MVADQPQSKVAKLQQSDMQELTPENKRLIMEINVHYLAFRGI